MITILITSDEFLYTKKGGLGFMFNNYTFAALYVFLVQQLDMSTSFSVSLNKQFIHSLVLLSSSEMQPPTTRLTVELSLSVLSPAEKLNTVRSKQFRINMQSNVISYSTL